MDDLFQREEALFAGALELPATERAAFLRAACGENHDLLAQVESLLAKHGQPADFLETPPERELADAARLAPGAGPAGEAPGERMGRYRLIEKIGEGGCGAVYRAEQMEPVRREVALKIIKLGMDTKAVIARFEAERQALALMEHPAIARALDAGATEAGRPFFAMELVRGTKITDFCDARKMGLEGRLRLFAQVCSAVQHAHQKGVIHRDLKPSNILVAAHDGAPAPKVIDFGIAKATQGRLTDRTLFTALDQFVGTPAYMSPEQAEFNAVDVDTRSDIYSLGVLLYELLTGRTPLDAEELRKAGVDEIRRRVREEQSPRPSARLRALDRAALTTAAANRRTEPARLVQDVGGDLDWIAMRCLEKDRARRYETANALARDIERHLAGEPVSARPPSAAYVAGKLIRRHRFGFAAGGAVAAVLLAGIAVSTRLYLREKVAREQAEMEKKKTETEARRSAMVAQFIRDMLAGVGPEVARGRDTAVLREILDATAKRLSVDLKDHPEVEGDLRAMLGDVYHGLRERDNAEAMQRAALALRREVYGPEHLKVAETLTALAGTLHGKGRLVEAERLEREGLAMQRRLVGDDHLAVAASLAGLGGTLLAQRKNAEALATLLEAHALGKKLRPEGDPSFLPTAIILGRALAAENRLAEAEAVSREILATIRSGRGRRGPSALGEANALDALGEVLLKRRAWAEAEECLRQSLAIMRPMFVEGGLRGRLAEVSGVLGEALFNQGKWAEAEDAWREATEIRRRSAEADSAQGAAWVNVVTSMSALVDALCAGRKYSEAERVGREALALCRKLPDRRPGVEAGAIIRVGDALAGQGRLVEAESVYREAWDTLRGGGGNWPVYVIARGLHGVLARQGRVAEMEPVWSEMIARSRLPADVRDEDGAGSYACALLMAMCRHGAAARAEPLARKNLAYWEERAPDDWRTFALRALLGNALVEQGKFAEAEPLLLSGCAGLAERSHRIPRSSGDALLFPHQHLVRLYAAWGKPEQAAEWRKKHEESRPPVRPP